MKKPNKGPHPRVVEATPRLSSLFVPAAIVLVAAIVYLQVISRSADPAREATISGLFETLGTKPHLTFDFGPNGSTKFYATKKLSSSDVVFSVPLERIIEPAHLQRFGSLAALIAVDNGTALTEAAQESQLGQTFFSVFMPSAFLALERRNETSWIHSWLNALPASPPATALDWPEDVHECLAASLLSHVQALHKVLELGLQLLNDMCSNAGSDAFCGGRPFTKEDLTWGISTYLSRNYQDQAIIPGLDFARIDNDNGHILSPKFNEATRRIDVTVTEGAKKGDELVLNWLRGPGPYLVARGVFLEGTRGIDVRIQPPTGGGARKYCAGAMADMMFETSGRPMPALINCVAVHLAEGHERKRLAKNPREIKSAELHKYIFGNLSAVAERELHELESLPERCLGLPTGSESVVLGEIKKNTHFMTKVLRLATAHLSRELGK